MDKERVWIHVWLPFYRKFLIKKMKINCNRKKTHLSHPAFLLPERLWHKLNGVMSLNEPWRSGEVLCKLNSYMTGKLKINLVNAIQFFGDSYEKFAVITDLQWSTCIHEWNIQLQKWHPLIDWEWRLTLWAFLAKIQQIKDVGDPGCSYRTILTQTQNRNNGPWRCSPLALRQNSSQMQPTCFRVRCNDNIILPGLKVLDVLPVAGKKRRHWDAFEIKKLWPRTQFHLRNSCQKWRVWK